VTGVQPGMTMCYCYYRGRQCQPGVPVYCWTANLQMSGLTGAAKLNPGGYFPLNANNDNGSPLTNGWPKTRDLDVSPNPNEKDLVQIVLDASGLPPNTPLTWNLSAPTSGHAVVKAWTDSIKTAPVGLPYSVTGKSGSDPLYYLEGTAEGYALMEISLTLQVTVNGSTATDIVNVTVTPVLQSFTVATNVKGSQPGPGTDANGGPTLTSLYSAPMDTSAMNMSAQAANNSINGELAFIQNTSFQNNLTGGKGALRQDGISWACDFGVVNGVNYAGQTLLDSADAQGNPIPWYVGATHNVATANGVLTLTDGDSPPVPVGTILPIVIAMTLQSTNVDLTWNFTTYTVWKYPDGSFYTLGTATWNIHYQGLITDDAAGNTVLKPGASNANNSSTGFTRGDTKPSALGRPVAINGNAAWR
jgi:hypothetical protein